MESPLGFVHPPSINNSLLQMKGLILFISQYTLIIHTHVWGHKLTWASECPWSLWLLGPSNVVFVVFVYFSIISELVLWLEMCFDIIIIIGTTIRKFVSTVFIHYIHIMHWFILSKSNWLGWRVRVRIWRKHNVWKKKIIFVIKKYTSWTYYLYLAH